ncbi:hypothetical protein SUS17_1448 [Sphingomonas sp. S17]|jgi:hypothetical protein|uniref:Uncharacterized protein n=2 Tax=Sphingomonas paucimobilis TaxID=13689 RepID=A0A411LN37_SPHPI|nr:MULTISPECIES: hypothetical protein [Sphingomonas]EGI55691.1 hypothetical protein SUS17_1448 [Sphingomonas sp. S17]MBQ1478554.1 hypothetical protein [Sphingomonas sp.]MCM3679599.1 hypothetical protein [Sphingomonas paucimobilis]MDG5971007.1 hypothetical protein [Sphingomonas paucimobilis]NNG58494.1 hypothetical protein [Sphingomonas paucimobilis]
MTRDKTRAKTAGAIGILLSLVAGPAAMAQQVAAPAGYAPLTAPCTTQPDGRCAALSGDTPMPVATRAERLVLVGNNVAVAPVTALGGLYVLNQSCNGYGTVTLRYLGADGITMLPLLTRTASDTGGGTNIYLGAGAVVDINLSGTSGCNANLARVPA